MLILITGASGSGTTTLGAALANEFGIAHLDADEYYWLPTTPPFTHKRDHAERLSSLLRDVRAKENAVVSGSIMDWGLALENAFDFIIFLYLDASIRVERLRIREIEFLGKANPEFLEWAAQYDDGILGGRSLAKHQAWLSARTCPVIELRGDISVRERVAAVLKHVTNSSIERGDQPSRS
jgi:AAA domain